MTDADTTPSSTLSRCLNVLTHLLAVVFLGGLAVGLTNLRGVTSVPPAILRGLILLGGVGVLIDDWGRTRPSLEDKAIWGKLGLFLYTVSIVVILSAAVSPGHVYALLAAGLATLGASLLLISVDIWYELDAEDGAGGYEVPDDPTELLDDDSGDEPE